MVLIQARLKTYVLFRTVIFSSEETVNFVLGFVLCGKIEMLAIDQVKKELSGKFCHLYYKFWVL